MFERWKVLQMNDIVMYQLSDVIHMDFVVFGPMSLHWVSAKIESTLILTPNDSWMMKLDAKINE
jgi:hypothetical protein